MTQVILCLSRDLAISSRVESSAARFNLPVRTFSSFASPSSEIPAADKYLVIIDLQSVGTEIQATIDNLRQAYPEARFVAFAPHVYTERLEEARRAGCDQVISRGTFFRQLDEIIGNFAQSRE